MKRILILFSLILGFVGFQSCDDEQQISYSKLPQQARIFIEAYFPQSQVAYAEKEKDDGIKEYKAILDDGTEIEFDNSGKWTSVDCKFATLPVGILPTAITDHIAQYYPQAEVYKAEKQLGGYEVSISGNIELVYSSSGKFVREQRD